MKLFGDYHTHTIYSHGKGTIMENAIVAKQKGLNEIAITDHGFSHKLFGVNRKNLDKMREDCILATEKTGVKVLLGIEANFISSEGDVDIIPSDLEALDIILCGYHKTAKATSLKEQLKYFVPNNNGIFLPGKKTIQKNTLAVIKAIEKYPIAVITHLGVGNPVDVKEVASVAKSLGVKIELNGKRIAFSQKDIEDMIEMQTEFIINSDAHSSSKVGECNKGTNLALKYNIPNELICNMDKKPIFRK